MEKSSNTRPIVTGMSYGVQSSTLLAILVATIMAGGCATDGSGSASSSSDGYSKTAIGAAVGAIGGAIAGQAVGGKRKDTLIGAVIGGLAGAGVGNYMDRQQRELEAKLERERRSKLVSIQRLSDNSLKLNLDSSATFASASSRLNSGFSQSLLRIAQVIGKNDQTIVHVLGFTDSVGSAGSNKVLSQRRAQSVEQFFTQNGVASNRIRTVGYGESHPVASNKDEAGRSQNRRVEIYLRPVVKGREQDAYKSPVL